MFIVLCKIISVNGIFRKRPDKIRPKKFIMNQDSLRTEDSAQKQITKAIGFAGRNCVKNSHLQKSRIWKEPMDCQSSLFTVASKNHSGSQFC